MFLSRVKAFLFPALLLPGVAIYGQTASISDPLTGHENNPYSKFGIGELWNGNSTELKGMGNITSAFVSSTELNPDNPASYAFLSRIDMECGALASNRVVAGANSNYSTGTFTPSYLMIGMPVGKNGGLSFGMRPLSRVYYNLADTLTNSAIGMVQRSYSGIGGLNYAYIGYGHKFHDLAVGVNVQYFFGQILNSISTFPIDSAAINRAYTAVAANNVYMGGLYWKVGLIYQHHLADTEYFFRLGGIFALSQNLYENQNAYQASIYYFGDTTVNDTTYNPGTRSGKLKMPTTFSVGAMLEKADLWSVGVDFMSSNWNTYKSNPDTTMNVNIASSSNRFSLGGSYSPQPAKTHKHYTKITYRMGVYYGNDYLVINNTSLPNYGLTVGASIHFKPSHFSWVNLHTALDLGRLGTTQSNLVQQTYFRWSLGISFNDRWFIPRKYD